MRAAILRVDLRTPGLRFVGTPRASNWGEPFPGMTNSARRVRTLRQFTVDFLSAERARGRNMVAAFNTAFWGPSIAPQVKYANPLGLNISDGVVVSDDRPSPCKALFVAWNDGRCEITETLAEKDFSRVQVAHSGSDRILRAGRNVARDQSVHPRTACGLSADGHYFYLLVVDGRQPKWSVGATQVELGRILSAAGAAEAMNFDGGGSSSFALWDGTAVRMVNRHANGYRRATAMNIGICLPAPLGVEN